MIMTTTGEFIAGSKKVTCRSDLNKNLQVLLCMLQYVRALLCTVKHAYVGGALCIVRLTFICNFPGVQIYIDNIS